MSNQSHSSIFEFLSILWCSNFFANITIVQSPTGNHTSLVIFRCPAWRRKTHIVHHLEKNIGAPNQKLFTYIIDPERFVKFNQRNIVGKSATSVIILVHNNFFCLTRLPSAIYFIMVRKYRITWLVCGLFQPFPEFSSCLSASISLIPAWILTLLGFFICRPCMQWAAVKTHWGWIRVPPQNWLHSEPHPLFSSNATIHGVCPGANLTPFIIRPWISASSSGFRPFQEVSTHHELRTSATGYARWGEIRGDLHLITSIIEFIILWALFFTFWTGKGFFALFLFTFNLLKLSFAFLFQKDSKFFCSQISTSYR